MSPALPLLLLILLCSSSIAGPPAVPNTLEDAYVALDGLLSPEQRIVFMQKKEIDAVTDAHRTLGMYIRNMWFRSGGSTLPGLLQDAGARHLDDMSSMILTSYWRHLNGVPIDLQQQGACYTRWWAEQGRIEADAMARGDDSYGDPAFDCP